MLVCILTHLWLVKTSTTGQKDKTLIDKTLYNISRPNSLEKGDTVGLLALACKVDFEILKPAIDLMEDVWGLKVILGKSLTSEYHQFAGTDEIRANDFQVMLDNPEIKAIFSVQIGRAHV